MRKSLSFCLLSAALSFSGFTQAQDTLKLYFNSGKSTLTTESRQKLDQLVKQTALMNDYDIDLKAYTDDIGSIRYNKFLSNNRASSVWNYLESADVTPSTKKISGLGELALRGKNGIKEQRRQNRRVDVIVHDFDPQSVEDAFSYLSNRDREEFVIDATKEQQIIGQEGTVIKIPANAFCTADGQVVSDVKITIKEAYQFGDMIAHNLTTGSGDQLLETGGMIFIDAQSSNGEQLQLIAGVNLDVKMPSTTELKEDMQLFVTDRSGNEFGESTDWKATNQAFQRVESTPMLRVRRIGQLNKNNLLQEDECFLAELPLYQTIPVRPKKPTLHTFTAKPADIERIKANTPKKFLESSESYQARLKKKLEIAENNYAKAQEMYAQATERHIKAMKKYQLDMERYTIQVEDYQSYLAEIDAQSRELDSLILHINGIKRTYKHVGNIFGPTMGAFKGLANYKESMATHTQNLNFTALNAQINNLTAVNAPSFIEERVKDCKRQYMALHNALEHNKFGKKINLVSGYYTYAKREDFSRSTLHTQGFAKAFPNMRSYRAQQNFNEELKQFYRNYNSIQEQEKGLSFLSDFTGRHNELLAQLHSDEVRKDLNAQVSVLMDIYDAVIDKKIDCGLMSKQDEKKILLNSIKVSGLGWINCDRFLDMEEDMLVKVELPCKAKGDIQFFVILDEMNSMVSLRKNQSTGKYISGYSGLPKDATVRVIGLNINDAGTSVFEFEGKASDINNLDVKFEKVDVKSLRKKLAQV